MANIDHYLIYKTLNDGLADRPYIETFVETSNNNELDLYTTFLAVKVGLLNTTYHDVESNQDRNKIDNLIYDPLGLIKSFDTCKNLITKLKEIPTLQFLLTRIEAYLKGADKLLEMNKGDAIAQLWVDVTAPLLVKRALFEIVASPTSLLTLFPNLDLPGGSINVNQEPSNRRGPTLSITVDQEHLNKFNLTYLLDTLDTLYPKLKIKDLEAPLPPIIMAPKLYQGRHYEPVSSSMVADTLFSSFDGKTLEFEQIGKNKLMAMKRFNNGYISMVIKADDEDKVLIAKEGEYLFKIMAILISTSINKKPLDSEYIEVRGEEILETINQLYVGTDGKRNSKLKNLNWLAKHLDLIRRIDIQSGEITSTIKGKQNFKIDISPLINVKSFRIEGQGDLFHPLQTNPIYSLKILYKPGQWFDYFCSDKPQYFMQYGLQHHYGFSSNDLAAKVLRYMAYKLEQHKTGDFKVETILEGVGLGDRLKELKTNSVGAQRAAFLKTFHQAISTIQTQPEAYGIEYRNPPTFLVDESTRKPKGWFDIWLNTTIIFTKPPSLLPQSKKVSAPKPRTKKVDIEALEKAIANSGLSKRTICQYLGHTASWLTKKIKNGTITPKDQADILEAIKVLNKRKK